MGRNARRLRNRSHTGFEPRARDGLLLWWPRLRICDRVQCPALSGDSLGTRERNAVWQTTSPRSLCKWHFLSSGYKAGGRPGPACARRPGFGSGAGAWRSNPAGQAGASWGREGCAAAATPRLASWRSSSSPGWGCENLATVPAWRLALAPPRPWGRPAPDRRPAPGPARARPFSGPRPGPRPSADAPLAGSARRACPQAPAGSAPPLGGSHPPATRGPACRVPWATISRETGPRPRHRHPVRSPPVRESAGSQCPPPRAPPGAGLCPPGAIRDPGVWGLGEAGAFPGGPASSEEAEAGGRALVWAASCSPSLLISLHPFCASGGPRIGVPCCCP